MKKKFNQTRVGNAPASPLRRKTIKTLAYGVGALAGTTVLPDKWVTPIIQGIALPAHAQTSAPSQLALAFCNDRVDLTLVAGNSSTGDVTINATGCLSSAEANVTFNLTLAGYAHPVVTDTGQSAAGGFLAAVSEAFVPSAHAAQQPLCTQVVSVTTGSKGAFEATFTLSCGPGIAQVELMASAGGGPAVRAGWLDIPGFHPESVVRQDAASDAEPGRTDQVPYECSTGLELSVNGGPYSQSGEIDVGDTYELRNNNTFDVLVNARLHAGINDYVQLLVSEPLSWGGNQVLEGVLNVGQGLDWTSFDIEAQQP